MNTNINKNSDFSNIQANQKISIASPVSQSPITRILIDELQKSNERLSRTLERLSTKLNNLYPEAVAEVMSNTMEIEHVNDNTVIDALQSRIEIQKNLLSALACHVDILDMFV